MGKRKADAGIAPSPRSPCLGDDRALAREILRRVADGTSRVEFLREMAGLLLDVSGCDSVELCVRREDHCFRCKAARRVTRPFRFEITRSTCRDRDIAISCDRQGGPLDETSRAILGRKSPDSAHVFTERGNLWTGDARHEVSRVLGLDATASGLGGCRSLAVILLTEADSPVGLMQLRSRRKNLFRPADIACLESVAETLGLALVSRFAHASLHERVKELTCLYALAQLAEQPGAALEDVLQGIVEALPQAWQYPDAAVACIVFDGRRHATPGYRPCAQRQSADFVVAGRRRGSIEIGYTQRKPDVDEGPFLQEERSLIDAVARQIVALVERRDAAEEGDRLQNQLRHADRLATIGQLSAGVAHELNEPLGNILALAQLAAKEPGIPPQAAEDLDKIVAASLHARAIIRKLMLFARQVPPRKTLLDLNAVVEDGLYFLEARCAKEGVTIRRHLADHLPAIVADPSQLNQVLVNLVVNAIQAVPRGGTLTVGTCVGDGHVALVVEDDGAGMDEAVLGKIFTPFFTTKDIDEGTGLGLPVVHGIVASHGGTIDVRSRPGKGTRFEVRLPAHHVEDSEDMPRQ